MTATLIESTDKVLPVLFKEPGTPTTPEMCVKSEDHDRCMNVMTPVAGHKRCFSSISGQLHTSLGMSSR